MKKQLWNLDWQFSDVLKGGASRTVNLPFDAMLTEKREPRLKSGAASGYYPGGKYCYTKNLYGDPAFAEQTILLEFEGIYQKSTVYLNGVEIGGRIYGYSDFYVDLTNRLKLNENNEIKVIADNTQQPNSRWYSGSGIYRDVYLVTAGKNYIKPDGVRVKTKSIQPAVIEVCIDSVKTEAMTLVTEVWKDGAVVASGTGAELELTIPNVKLWDAEHPELYRVVVELRQSDKLVDSAEVRTGIRSLKWDAKNGFQVNGKTVKLRGGCIHHDNGPLGAASFYKAELRRVEIMKAAGFNAIRYSHNPAGKAFLDACDEAGIYVMDETFDTWGWTKSEYDYGLYFEQEWKQDVEDMIRIAYNHPAVIMYSIGNEVSLKNTELVERITTDMVNLCHKLDASRPVTNAMNIMTMIADGKKPDISKQDEVCDPCRIEKDGKATGSLFINMMVTIMPFIMKSFAKEKTLKKVAKYIVDPLDILGLNYASHLNEPHHEDFPNRVMVGAETFPSHIAENWEMVEKMPWLIGDFAWTGWDYLGEAGVGLPVYNGKASFTRPYPCISASCSNIDMTGFIDSQGYYSAIVWGQYKKPYIAVHPVNHSGEKVQIGQWRFTDAVHSWSWNGQEGKRADIDVYSIGDSIELIQDGKSLGIKKLEKCMASYQCVYQRGELVAVSFDKAGNELAREALKTAGVDTVLRAEPEAENMLADGMDLLYIPVLLCDEQGITKNLEDRDVTVRVEGAATLQAVGSGNPETTQNFTSNTYKTFRGRMLAVLRSNGETGDVTVRFSAQGVPDAVVTVQANT